MESPQLWRALSYREPLAVETFPVMGACSLTLNEWLLILDSQFLTKDR